MRFSAWFNGFLLSSIATLLSGIAVSADLANDITVCDPRFGQPLFRAHCLAALLNLPDGSSLPSIFTTRRHSDTNNYEQVPRRFVDTVQNPACAITVDLEGHSMNDVFFLIPWDVIRSVAHLTILHCVGRSFMGGKSTYGIHRAFEAIIAPTPYDPGPGPVAIVNPDGSVDSIAVRPGHVGGISESLIW